MEKIGVGKNIEKAIEDALFQLRATREDVDIKILEEGGVFKKAKVLVSISEDAIEKYQKREELKKEEHDCECEHCHHEECDCDEDCDCDEECDCGCHEVCECDEECHCHEDCECGCHDECDDECDCDKESEAEKCKEFVIELLEKANMNAEVEVRESKDELFISITGEGVSGLIGYRGECVNALQYLISVYNSIHNRHSKKVRLDINNFREQREKSLIALANRIAQKVIKTNHQCKLEPMSANERRIIHTALQNNEKVTTMSKGDEPKRYLIIMPKED